MQSQRPRKQRNRISFSCTNCRQGKYRCDRRTPCSTCVRRDTHESCQYEEAAVASSRRISSTGQATGPSKKSISADPRRPDSSKSPDISIFGYSKMGANHTLAILNELSRVDSASNALQKDHISITMPRSPSYYDNYLRLLRGLPPRLYVYILVDIFFEQVNWQYSIVDRNYFMPQLTDFYKALPSIFSEDPPETSHDVFTFPSLLFQVVGSAFQFLPPDYDRSLDDLRMGRSFDDLAKSYSDSGIEMLALFEKDNLNLSSVQAGFLRVALLKSFGYVLEAYRMVGQVVADSEEAGLNIESDGLQAESVELTPSRLWYHEMRRRVMVNLWLWDSQMSIVLGKPSKANAGNWSITLPLDAPIPGDQSQTIPMERQPHEKPTQFTHRLVEYQMLSQLPGVQKLIHGEFNPHNFAQIQKHEQKMRNLVEELPPAFRFENTDTQWDLECPWIKTQREYSCGTTNLSLMVMHRYAMFHIPQSRTEVIKCGIEVLKAQERHFRTLSVQHHKLYALAFFTLEAAAAIMVVFIAYPSENRDLFAEAMVHIKASIARLSSIETANAFARPVKELMQLLKVRAENLHKEIEFSHDSKPPHLLQDSRTPSYHSANTNTNAQEIKPPHWQTASFDFAAYTPPALAHEFSHSDTSNSTPPISGAGENAAFDFSCGGIINQYGPIATVVDNVYYTVPDTWDPMILLERADGTEGYVGGGGYGQDIY
ncbi:hypothetical protein L207DRAFT_426556 [Hyaloscypha variabilis F]|uniref:Zn(2)-C6 fungal-type domain-containing protein n=1 Tax=Hyaloscypha variabilis (strain UAMH 11265 / GT02V1 / F) TaxID=1149755 RepID=A0A2J6RTN1_HYAVF|nr:hypothetical protein L207DRAFT_426556 [Hyaloscypha variabilis F]